MPSEDNPTACYRVPFDVPLEWVDCVARSQRELFLILHGAGSGVDIFVNGKHVGYGQDSMTGGYICEFGVGKKKKTALLCSEGWSHCVFRNRNRVLDPS